MGWAEGAYFGVVTDNPCESNAVFINTATGVIPFPPAAWCNVYVGPVKNGAGLNVPLDAVAVDLSAELIITGGQETETEMLALSVKAPSSTLDVMEYCMQADATTPGSSTARTNGFTRAPVENGYICVAWLRGNTQSAEWPGNPIPPYPQGASYGINLDIVGYVR